MVKCLFDDFNNQMLVDSKLSGISFDDAKLACSALPVAIARPAPQQPVLMMQTACFRSLFGERFANEILGLAPPLTDQGAIGEEAKEAIKQFWRVAGQGRLYAAEQEAKEALLGGVPLCWTHQPDGELVVVSMCANGDSNADCIFYLKQVELDDEAFVVILADVNGGLNNATSELANRMQYVPNGYCKLQQEMDDVESVLTSVFWYSAPMRRQSSSLSTPVKLSLGYGLLPAVFHATYSNLSLKMRFWKMHGCKTE